MEIVLKHVKKLKLKRRGIATLARLHVFGHPSRKLKIIGATGTNGKTTVATLLYRVTKELGFKVGLISTVENLIDGEQMSADYNAPSTTPDPIFLHKLLNKMVKEKCEYVFMEVTSHALDQDRVAGLNFTGGVFTNLTHDHLDYHKTMENYFGAKKKFFKMLGREAFALSNIDDDHGVGMLAGIRARRYSYGFNKNTDFKGEIKNLNFDGLEVSFNHTLLHTKLLGKFNAYNLLAVWGACSLLGFDMDRVHSILEKIEPPRGRFEYMTTDTGVLVVVDYAHTPDALQKVLETITEIKKPKSRIISVFGCGGDRDPMKRPVMGSIGAGLSDIAIFTSDNPRNEDPNKIIEDMKKDLSKDDLDKVLTIADRHEAILESVKRAQSGDIILCAGKGHEDYQEIKGVKNHFDDMEEFKKAYERI